MRPFHLALLVVLAFGSPAFAGRRIGPPSGVPLFAVPSPTTATCWEQERWFDSLRHGPVNYCRQKLRYRPGALECNYYVGQGCWVFDRHVRDFVQTFVWGPPIVFPCPDGPEPPVCPRMR